MNGRGIECGGSASAMECAASEPAFRTCHAIGKRSRCLRTPCALLVWTLAIAPFAFGQEEGGPGCLLASFLSLGFIIQIALQLIAIIHCAKSGRDRFWIWIIIIGGLLGTAAYFVVEGLPEWRDIKRSFKGPARRKRIAALRVLVRDNPSAGNYEELGELLVHQKRWAEARDAFDRAITARADSPDPFYWRGVAAFEMGDDTAAINDFQYVVKIDPKYDYSRAQCLLARALARSGKTAEAMAAFDRLLEASSASESQVSAAEFYAANGRAAEARQIVEGLLARRATMPSYQKRRDRPWLNLARKLDRRLA